MRGGHTERRRGAVEVAARATTVTSNLATYVDPSIWAPVTERLNQPATRSAGCATGVGDGVWWPVEATRLASEWMLCRVGRVYSREEWEILLHGCATGYV